MQKNLILLMAFILFDLTSYAQTTYYVSHLGNDGNTGTEEHPFLTISKAINSFGGTGGTCIIREGYYHENVSIHSKNNITIKAYANEKVIINGTKKITSLWTQSLSNPNIYETTLTEDIWQLFIDDERQVMARWPNAQFNDDSVYDQSNWSSSDSNMGSNGIMIDTGNLASSGLNVQGALAIANVGSFKTWTVEVLSHSPGNNSFTYETAGSYKTKHHYYFLERKLEFLDTQNEWFYDTSSKKLSIWGNPTGKKIQGKVQSYAITMSSCSNITIESLNFFSTTIKAATSTNITINNCLFSYPSCSKRMLGKKGAPLVTELSSNSNNNTTRFKFYQCLFEHTDGEAFYMNGEDNIVEDCYFHHIDYTVSSLRNLMTSVVNNGANGTFTKNTVHTTGASSTVYFVGSPKVSYNDISNTGTLQSDGSIVQITRVSVDGSEVHHNWFHDSPKSGMRYDAPISEPEIAGKNGLVHHNVMWHLSKALQIKGDEQQIYNNTCFDNYSNDISVLDEAYPDPPGGSSNTLTITRNNASDKISGHRNNPQAVPGTIDHNIYSTTSTDYGIKALLNDPDNYDFTPKASASQLIDAGTPIAGITDGFSGSAPNIGAYEIGDTWMAGATWTPDFYPWSFLTLSTENTIKTKFDLKLYPNPTQNILHIKTTESISEIKIYNTLGKHIITKKGNIKAIILKHFGKGLYVLKIQTQGGYRVSKKVFIIN